MKAKREGLATLVVLAAGLYLLGAVISQAYDALKPSPYSPLYSRPFFLTEGQVYEAGQVFEVRNGLCNESDDVIIVEVFVGMQRDLSDGEPSPTLEGASVVSLVGSSLEPEELVLFPGCVGTQPLKLRIPGETQPGTYHLFLRAVTKGDSGEEQREILTSEAFEVKAGEDGP